MKKIISFILALTLLFATAVSAKDYSDYPQKFSDVPKTHWAFQQISELYDKNVISGYSDGRFKPNNTVTRAEWAKIKPTAVSFKMDSFAAKMQEVIAGQARNDLLQYRLALSGQIFFCTRAKK